MFRALLLSGAKTAASVAPSRAFKTLHAYQVNHPLTKPQICSNPQRAGAELARLVSQTPSPLDQNELQVCMMSEFSLNQGDGNDGYYSKLSGGLHAVPITTYCKVAESLTESLKGSPDNRMVILPAAFHYAKANHPGTIYGGNGALCILPGQKPQYVFQGKGSITSLDCWPSGISVDRPPAGVQQHAVPNRARACYEP